MALPSPRKPQRRRPPKERRAPPAAPGSLRWLKGLFGRPIGFERREGRLHLVLVERRHRPDLGLKIELLRDELGARLLAQGAPGTVAAMSPLGRVHDALGRKGWRSVESLPALELSRALRQARMLMHESPSPALAHLVDRLRLLHVGAELREQQRERAAEASRREAVQVIDSTPEEYEATERQWGDTVSPADPK
jgi:hypothetical protein